jgi:predicted methyltransferase
MLRLTDHAHLLLRHTVKPGAWVIDATVGNGHDTLFLADLVGPQGRVFGFDIQQQALAVAAQRLTGLPQVTLIHAGHEHLAERLPAGTKGRIGAAMFNLGYLPGAEKELITRAQTTLPALDQALDALAAGGLVTLMLYSAHDGGADEAAHVRAHVERLPPAFAATRTARLDTGTAAPELLVIERLR